MQLAVSSGVKLVLLSLRICLPAFFRYCTLPQTPACGLKAVALIKKGETFLEYIGEYRLEGSKGLSEVIPCDAEL